MRLTSCSLAPTASECFARTMAAGAWQKINNGLSALYESCLAINAAGDIYPGVDFVNGAGGVFGSTDNWQSRVEMNDGVIQTDIRALAINSNGHIFCRNLFWRWRLSMHR